MTVRHALVVDDSRSARQSLARLLSQYDLEVHFAESGEEALEFLKHRLVDVIFMDHTMPGMDGLEAVSAIKGNPRTATIPVMMYTAKEGEVYVGQARALGALGVLPKQVQPGVLYDMLRKLGLTRERRVDDGANARAAPPPDPSSALTDETDRTLNERALGASIAARVTRLLDEQHARLVADVLAGQRRLARDAARDAVREVLAERGRDEPAAATDVPQSGPRRGPWIATVIGAGTLCVLLALIGWQLRLERDALLAEQERHDAAAESRASTLRAEQDALGHSAADRQRSLSARLDVALGTVEWALNQGLRVPFDEPPFNDALAGQLEVLLRRLADADFQGTVTLTAHFGTFCLVRDDAGALIPAPGDLPATDCELIGHPLQDAMSVESLQSLAFAATLTYLAAAYDRISVTVLAESNPAGTRIPSGAERAGDWNRRASADNRVSVTLGAATAP